VARKLVSHRQTSLKGTVLGHFVNNLAFYGIAFTLYGLVLTLYGTRKKLSGLNISLAGLNIGLAGLNIGLAGLVLTLHYTRKKLSGLNMAQNYMGEIPIYCNLMQNLKHQFAQQFALCRRTIIESFAF